jgi:hypothetical protein
MKNILLLLALFIVAFSCNTTSQPKSENTPIIEDVPTSIGIQITDDGVKSSIVVGEMGNTSIWEKYIKAHNDKDLETIASINAIDFKGYPPNGTVIDGSKTHISFLKKWFADSNPKWTTRWMIANAATNKDGVEQQWLTTGQELTDSVEGEQITLNHIHDVLFVDGKIKMINVYERAKAIE